MNSDHDNNGYNIIRLGKENLNDVAKLYAAVYGRPAPENFFEKKYATVYTGIQYIGYIAYNKDRVPVGYYGVIPCFLQDGGAIILSAQSADTMTHPGYRYKGLFVELSNMTFDLARSEGIRIIIGFPNQHSFHGAIHKLGWKMTETMDCFSIPVSAIPLERVVIKFPFLKPLYSKYKKWVLRKYITHRKNISNSVFSDGYSGINRDTHYLAYKTYNESVVIRIGQSVVWIKIHSGLIIGDMTVTSDQFDYVMHEIQKLAKRLGVNQIQFQISPSTSLHTLFAERYKSTPSFPVLFQDLGSRTSLDKFKFTFADIDIF